MAKSDRVSVLRAGDLKEIVDSVRKLPVYYREKLASGSTIVVEEIPNTGTYALYIDGELMCTDLDMNSWLLERDGQIDVVKFVTP